MDPINARPELLKQMNLARIRRVLRDRGTATRAEIVEATHISFTTVRALLAELLERGELEVAGQDESSGGRKAQRYHFRPDCCYGAAICISGLEMYGLLVNICGEVVQKQRLDGRGGDFEPAIIEFLDELTKSHALRAIGIGVPGVVEGGCYWKKDTSNELYKVDLGEKITKRYGIPVLLENDLNATAIGFGRCYVREFPEERTENTNMAYIHFEKGCISAGFISGGQIVRGHHNFAGELGLIPMDNGQLMDEALAFTMDDRSYTNRIIHMICWICAILNPQYVALGGSDLRSDCVGPIGDGLSALLPDRMNTEILYAPDVWHDYFDGMAWLTAEAMFEKTQPVFS